MDSTPITVKTTVEVHVLVWLWNYWVITVLLYSDIQCTWSPVHIYDGLKITWRVCCLYMYVYFRETNPHLSFSVYPWTIYHINGKWIFTSNIEGSHNYTKTTRGRQTESFIIHFRYDISPAQVRYLENKYHMIITWLCTVRIHYNV